MAISGTPINCIDTSTLEGAVFNLRATLKKKTEEWFNYLNSPDYATKFHSLQSSASCVTEFKSPKT